MTMHQAHLQSDGHVGHARTSQDPPRSGGHFANAGAIAHYTDGPLRMVPGLAGLHRMAAILLAERAPHDARILVLGAGGGMELKVFAEAQPAWEFDGVDLRPGAPLVVAHFSFPQGEGERELWLSRYAAFATASGIDHDQALAASAGIGARLPILAPEQDEALLQEAGFSDVSLFYAGFTFHGWVAYA